MSKRNKEPAMLRKTPKGDWVVSREWIGWFVLEQEDFLGIDAILDAVAITAPDFVGASKGITATVSRDGKGVVTFSEEVSKC